MGNFATPGNIFNRRFYGFRKPGWHETGIVNDVEQSAVETLPMIRGDFNVETMPLFYMLDGVQVESTYKVIVRAATPDDPQPRVLGAPVQNYDLITPMDAAKMWDAKTGAPVETMAILGKGDNMFITAVLPTVQIAGYDEVRNYLLFNNPMKSGMGASAYITSIRTVCENTLRSGIAAASSHYTISHRPGGRELLGNWLADRWQSANEVVDVLAETYNILAKKTVKDVQVKWIAEALYPMPQQPDRDRPRMGEWADVREEWERQCQKAIDLRTAVVNFHAGEGTGLDDSRIRGTAWSAWNAVAEVESWRRGRKEAMVMSLTNGERANRIIQAQTMLMNLNSSTRQTDIRNQAQAYAAL